MNNILKKTLPFLAVAAVFLLISYGFVPEVLTGKIVDQDDIAGYVGMSREVNQWNAAHPDDQSAWTNSMFGGMPTIMIDGKVHGDFTKWIFDTLLLGRRPASYFLISLVGAFLLMLALGCGTLVSAGAAAAMTFCSYNMQIIQVGHNSKMLALAFLPWVLAAVIYTYRKALDDKKERTADWLKPTLLGAALFAMALNFQIKANHVQITYYLAIILACYVTVLFVWLLLRKRNLAGRFAAASALLLVLGSVGIAVNANKLLPTYLYTQETMRGGSELASEDGKSKGLDLGYATSWSYGWEELPNMLIPNYNGGSSAGAVNPDKSRTIAVLKEAGQTNLRQTAKHLPLYWGPQPYTAGPMYMGAVTVFLFLLGLFLYKGKEKWWIAAASIIGILLALGSHFLPFTEFWYNHMPFYSKFRTVSMALVILQFTLPVLGFLMLDRIVRGEVSLKEYLSGGGAALLLSAGFCLLSLVAGRTYVGPADSSMPDVLVEALAADRQAIFTRDCIMTVLLLAVSFLLPLWALSGKEEGRRGKLAAAAAAICVICACNLFVVGKRYLNSDHFTTPKRFAGQFQPRPVDEFILADSTLSYRVLDLSVNTFNDAWPSYFHKCIGGYSAVKLQRYQDLVDRGISGEINGVFNAIKNVKTVQEAQAALPALPILSMLNTRYIIVDGNALPLENTQARGNCWFADSVALKASAAEELSALAATDLGRTAVVGADAQVPAVHGPGCGEDGIDLISYAPNQLIYKYSASSDRLAVFSEIYYPRGWKAQLEDGTPVSIFRADWTLRGAVLPAGSHELTFRFAPESYKTGAGISRAASFLLLLLLAGLFFGKLLLTLRKQ